MTCSSLLRGSEDDGAWSSPIDGRIRHGGARGILGMGLPALRVRDGGAGQGGIFNADFGYNLFVTILPFSTFLAIVALIHTGWPWAKGHSGGLTASDAVDTKYPES